MRVWASATARMISSGVNSSGLILTARCPIDGVHSISGGILQARVLGQERGTMARYRSHSLEAKWRLTEPYLSGARRLGHAGSWLCRPRSCLFDPEGHHRIEACRSPGRDQTGHETYDGDEQDDAGGRQRIRRADLDDDAL